MKILIVEDEPGMLENITKALEQEQHVIESAPDYKSAEMKIGVYEYDCVLLDIGLPDGNGLDLLKKLKSTDSKAGVIVVSAKNSLDDKLRGLNIGADDYLPKPFHMAELNARLNAVYRRRNLNGNETLKVNNLEVFPEKRILKVNNKEVNLYRKEFEILLYLLVNKNRLLRKTTLAENVWGDYIDESDDFEFIYSQIKNLRKKLKDAGAEVEIKAVYGIGYKLIS